MVDLGRAEGVTTVALLTEMSVPGLCRKRLGGRDRSKCCRRGRASDVIELTVALAREMVAAVGLDDHDPADLLASGLQWTSGVP